MGKQKTASMGSFLQELILSVDVYKQKQGRITRQTTCGVIWVTFGLAAYLLYGNIGSSDAVWMPQYTVPIGTLALGLWLGFRLVNVPAFADFLIAVEAEVNKVSWPSKAELMRAVIVVILVIFLLAATLFSFDLVWQEFFEFIGVRPTGG